MLWENLETGQQAGQLQGDQLIPVVHDACNMAMTETIPQL